MELSVLHTIQSVYNPFLDQVMVGVFHNLVGLPGQILDGMEANAKKWPEEKQQEKQLEQEKDFFPESGAQGGTGLQKGGGTPGAGGLQRTEMLSDNAKI